MDRFEEMRSFVGVVEAGSFSRAAERLNLAKSAVSRRIADLEARLGVQLLNRTTRRLSLTEAGRRYHERAGRLLAELEIAEAEVSEEQAALAGRLRVAAPLSFGLAHLGPAIRDFAAANPDVRFEIDFSDRQVDLVHEGFDLAVRIAKLSDSPLIARRLTPVRHIAGASPAYLERHGVPREPADLESGHRLLHYSYRSAPAWRYVSPQGAPGVVRPGTVMEANNGEFLRDAAVAGLGIIIEPSFILFREIVDGRLVPLFPGYRWPEVAAYALYPPTRRVPRRLRAFIDYLVARFGEEPDWDRVVAEATAAGAAKESPA
jgi:DNA-binding transcriptional LysR family regulator